MTDKMALIRLSVERRGRLMLEDHLSSHEMFSGGRVEVEVGRGRSGHRMAGLLAFLSP